MKIAELSVKNPVFANLLLLVLLAGGLITYNSMTREVFPEIPLDMVLIKTLYTGAPSEEVEKQVTIPIENAVESVENIESIASKSYESLSVVEIRAKQGTKDLQKMVNDIRMQIDQIDNFPEDAEDPQIIEIKSEIPVIAVSITGTASEIIRRKVAEEVKEMLVHIPGVSHVQESGLRDLEIWVEVDPLRLSGLNIPINKVVDAIGSANVNLPAGNVKGARQEFPLRTSSELKRASDVESVVITRDGAGRAIRVSDVARVTETFEERESFGRIDGQEAITLTILKSRTGNTIGISNEVQAQAERMQSELPDGVEIKLAQDSSRYIRQRLKTLYRSGAIGLTLVCIALFLFLNWRMAFWTALGIPTSFTGAFLLMDYFGITVNMMSLFSLILVLGMVVDDAIIVTENVYRYLQKGYSSGRAAVVGASEVVKPILAATATTIAAFLPMLMMTGIMGKFISTIPIVVTITLIVSFVEAFLILPSHLADFAKPINKPLEKESAWFRKIRRRYRSFIKTALKRRYASLGIVIALVAFTIFYSVNYMKFVMFKSKDLVGFVVKVETPMGTKLEETGRLLAQLDEIALGIPKEDLLRTTSLVGMQIDYDSGRITLGSHLGQVLFESTEFDLPGRRNGFVVASEVREKVKMISGFRSIQVKELGGGPPIGHALEARLSGDDYGVLKEISRRMKERLKTIPGVVDVRDNYDTGKNEIHIKPDRERLSLNQMTQADLGAALRTYFDGRVATTIKRGKDDIDVVVNYGSRYRENVDFISQVSVTNAEGRQVRLASVADIEWKRGFPTINHFNRTRTIKVLADVDTDVITSGELTRMVSEEFEAITKQFPGYSLSFGGEREEQMKSIDSLLRASMLAVFIIYLILGTLFKSFLQPIVVILAIPFSYVGVIFGHWIMGEPVGILSLIGLAALTGIVVNDSLVMVDFINRSRLAGVSRWSSIMRSAFVRFRPIILTSVTTILGLSTIAFKTTGQSAFLAPMAISIVFGLVFSTILTLVVIPCIYAVLDDILLALFGKGSIVFHEREIT